MSPVHASPISFPLELIRFSRNALAACTTSPIPLPQIGVSFFATDRQWCTKSNFRGVSSAVRFTQIYFHSFSCQPYSLAASLTPTQHQYPLCCERLPVSACSPRSKLLIVWSQNAFLFFLLTAILIFHSSSPSTQISSSILQRSLHSAQSPSCLLIVTLLGTALSFALYSQPCLHFLCFTCSIVRYHFNVFRPGAVLFLSSSSHIRLMSFTPTTPNQNSWRLSLHLCEHVITFLVSCSTNTVCSFERSNQTFNRQFGPTSPRAH